jgi:hypothetical protein
VTIRPQYHFRPSSRGLLAWNVRRLVALSGDLPVRRVPLSDIAELDEDHWFAHGTGVPSPRRVAEHCRLIHEANLAHPIILDASGRVMDGMHRVCKALMLEKREIDAVRFDVDPEPDYVGRDPESLPYLTDDGEPPAWEG